MAVNTQVTAPGTRVRAVEEDIIGPQELGAADDFDAQAENGAAVDGIGVRVLDAESGDGGAGAVKALLIVCFLCCGMGCEF